MPAPSLQELINLLWNAPENAEWTPRTDKIDGKSFREWTESDDLETLGFLFTMLDDGRFSIEPPLTQREYLDFVKPYLERCFKENVQGEWTSGRYDAGWTLVGIFFSLWDSKVPQKMLTEMKRWLAQLYREGDAELRTCIENATLEHIFERKEAKKFFVDWKKDPVLDTAYTNASLWVEGGARTPLSRKRR